MAKEISVVDALAVLANNGLVFGEEHAAVIKEMMTATYLAQAVAILAGDDKHTGKLVTQEKGGTYTDEEFASEWANRLMSFAEDFANEFKGESKNVQGGAVRTVRVVGIDTPAGHLKIELRSE